MVVETMRSPGEGQVVRFKVRDAFEIPSRGRGVIGDLIAGAIPMGMLVKPEGADLPRPWRVVGIEFADSPSTKEAYLALILEEAPGLEELQRMCPRGSVLVSAEPAKPNVDTIL